MADPILGIGTLLQVNRGAGFTTIAKLTEIGEFGLEGSEVETTNHDSANGIREYIRGLLDLGSMDLTGIWVADATQDALMDDVLLGPLQPNLPYKITLPQGMGVFAADGYIQAFHIVPNRDDTIQFTGTLRWSGLPSFASTLATGLTNIVLHPAGTTVPAPAAGTYEYVNNQANGVASVKFTITAGGGQTIAVNGVPHTTAVEGASFALGAAGSITDFSIDVSESGKVTKTYHVAVVRAA